MALKQKITPEQKLQIYALYNQGLTHPEIADQLHIDNPQQVAGIVRAGLNFNKIKDRNKPATSAPVMGDQLDSFVPFAPLAPVQMSGAGSATLEAPTAPPVSPIVHAPPPVTSRPSAPVVLTQEESQPVASAPVSRPVHVSRERMQPPPTPEQAPADGFSGWESVGSFASGFNNTAMRIRYVVYRDEPAHGILGEHTNPFTETDLAKAYGSGLYRVQRFDPGNPNPRQTTVRVSEAFGEPRFPNKGVPARTGMGFGRFGNRPWARPAEAQGQEEAQFERPSLYDYRRHEPAPSTDAATESIKQIGNMSMKALELGEQARKQGPDSFVTKFFNDQQNLWQKQLEDNRRNDDQRRRDEDEKWERRQKEAETEHKRRQEDEEKRHDRELAKIKADSESRAKEAEAARRQLLDLEGAKLKVVEEQNKLRQDALNDELKRNREQQKEQAARLEKQLAEIQEATSAQIASSQEKFEKELQREREALDRELKLREKGQDKEHELNSKILDIKKESIEAQGSNEIFQVVNNLLNKFSSGFNQLMEWKKMEATTPEAQAAAVNKGYIFNQPVVEPEEESIGKPARKPAASEAAPTRGAAGQPTANKTGNGQAAAPVGEAQGEVNMQEIIREMVDQKFFKGVIEEWAVHVENEQDGTTFLNMYREWMCDPNDAESRKATTMFANFIAPRKWESFYGIIKDKLDKKTVAIFDTPHAKVFYETFRGLITEQIRAFWEEFAQQREAVNAGRRAAEGAPK